MQQTPVKIDFNIDRISLHGQHYEVSMLTKALIRLSKVVLNERKRLLLLYPNFYCGSIPLLVISSYYSMLYGNNVHPKILLITHRKETALRYQGFGNEIGNQFVDFIYSGTLTRGLFNRIKPVGSGRGKQSSRLKRENGFVFISSFNIKENVDDYNFIIIEDAQFLTKPRYRQCMDLLSKCRSPIFAIQTSPILSSTLLMHKKLNCTVWGWSEDLIKKDLKQFSSGRTSLEPETRFPVITFKKLPNDNYNNLMTLAWNSFAKSLKLRRTIKHEPDNLSRIFVDLSWLIRRVANLSVPFTEFMNTETEKGLMPTSKRIALIRGAVNNLPKDINQTLELENIISLCEAALNNESTKSKEIKSLLSGDSSCCIVAIDKLQHETLSRLYPDSSNGIRFFGDLSDQKPHGSVYLTGLTGSVDKDYKIIKSANADRCTVIGYAFEEGFIRKLEFNRQQLTLLLKNRLEVLKTLNLEKYS